MKNTTTTNTETKSIKDLLTNKLGEVLVGTSNQTEEAESLLVQNSLLTDAHTREEIFDIAHTILDVVPLPHGVEPSILFREVVFLILQVLKASETEDIAVITEEKKDEFISFITGIAKQEIQAIEENLTHLTAAIFAETQRRLREKRVQVICSLTHEQIRETLIQTIRINEEQHVGTGLFQLDALARKVRPKEGEEVYQEEKERESTYSLNDLALENAVAFTARNFDSVEFARFAKWVADEVHGVFLEHGFDADQITKEKRGPSPLLSDIRKKVVVNTRDRLYSLNERVLLPNYGKQAVSKEHHAKMVASIETPEERAELNHVLVAYDALQSNVINAWRQGDQHEMRALLNAQEEMIEKLLQLVSRYPVPKYLFSAVDLLLQQANNDLVMMLEAYHNTSHIPQRKVEEMLRGEYIIQPNFDRMLLETKSEMNRTKAQHISLSDVYAEKKNNRMFELLAALGRFDLKEINNPKERRRVSQNYLTQQNRVYDELYRIGYTVKGEANKRDVELSGKGLKFDVHDDINKLNFLELLSIIDNKEYSFRNRMLAQTYAACADAMVTISESDIFQLAHDANNKVLQSHFGIDTNMDMIINKFGSKHVPFDFEEREKDCDHLFKERVFSWGNTDTGEGEEVFFTSPKSVGIKDVWTIFLKMVSRGWSSVEEVPDIIRSSYHICHTVSEIENSVELQKNIQNFVRWVGDNKTPLDFVDHGDTDPEVARRNLAPGEYIIVDKLSPQKSNKNSSPLYKTIKIYGKVPVRLYGKQTVGVGFEIQFKPIDTVYAQTADMIDTESYHYGKTTEGVKEVLGKLIGPELHEGINVVADKRKEVSQKAVKEVLDVCNTHMNEQNTWNLDTLRKKRGEILVQEKEEKIRKEKRNNALFEKIKQEQITAAVNSSTLD